MARSRFTGSSRQFRMGLGNDLRHIEEHIAESRRMVHRQKGLIIRVQAAGVISWDARKISGYWNPTCGDWKNTGTSFGKASIDSKHSDAGHCRNTSGRAQLRL
jgi:hypothetical protein